jgi:hypothetical protein
MKIQSWWKKKISPITESGTSAMWDLWLSRFPPALRKGCLFLFLGSLGNVKDGLGDDF